MTLIIKDDDIQSLSDIEVQHLNWLSAQEIDRRGGRVDSYAAPHVWNMVAKILRENYPQTDEEWMRSVKDSHREKVLLQRRMIEAVALGFAKRFAEDDGFDPIRWLDRCSPDPDLYPFSELWDEDELD